MNKHTFYWVYILSDERGPYYVGVSTSPNNRYSGKKKIDMSQLYCFSSNQDAADCETFWIAELERMGFKLENKHKETTPVKGIIKGSRRFTIKRRYNLSKATISMISDAAIKSKVPLSFIINVAFYNLLETMSNNNITKERLIFHWQKDRFKRLSRDCINKCKVDKSMQQSKDDIIEKRFTAYLSPNIYKEVIEYCNHVSIKENHLLKIALKILLPIK